MPDRANALLDAHGVNAATCRHLRQQFTDQLRAYYDRHPAGAPIVQARTGFVDVLLQRIWAARIADLPGARRLALVAVGGYGRGELHACSDVDILVLAGRAGDISRVSEAIARFVTFLYDTGLDIGASVRSVRQCVDEGRRDVTIATTLIEARLLAGDAALFEQLGRRTGPGQMWPTRKFFAAKLAEQQARYDKFDATAYKLEPNVKESPGGLRDIHTIGWVAKRHFGARTLHELVDHGFLEPDEYRLLVEGHEFLSQVRNGLHLLAGRKHDHLLFDQQRELAQRFGYQDGDETLAVEQFMKRYYRTVQGPVAAERNAAGALRGGNPARPAQRPRGAAQQPLPDSQGLHRGARRAACSAATRSRCWRSSCCCSSTDNTCAACAPAPCA